MSASLFKVIVAFMSSFKGDKYYEEHTYLVAADSHNHAEVQVVSFISDLALVPVSINTEALREPFCADVRTLLTGTVKATPTEPLFPLSVAEKEALDVVGRFGSIAESHALVKAAQPLFARLKARGLIKRGPDNHFVAKDQETTSVDVVEKVEEKAEKEDAAEPCGHELILGAFKRRCAYRKDHEGFHSEEYGVHAWDDGGTIHLKEPTQL